jgi:glycine/D-amino acid oxidase-like deaminating enzyme
MRRAGVLVEMTRETDLPFPVAGAIRVDEQAQFHPLEYLAGLVSRIPGDGSHVFEQTRATRVKSGETAIVETNSGRVLARHVIVATQLPFLDRGLFFAKAHPQKSFAVSAEVAEARAPRGMYIRIDEPTRSIRSAPSGDGTRQLIVGGESGGGAAAVHWAALAQTEPTDSGSSGAVLKRSLLTGLAPRRALQERCAGLSSDRRPPLARGVMWSAVSGSTLLFHL